jgi:hypothetical protein
LIDRGNGSTAVRSIGGNAMRIAIRFRFLV